MRSKTKRAISLLEVGALVCGMSFAMACNPTDKPEGNGDKYSSVLPTYAKLEDPLHDGLWTSIYLEPFNASVADYQALKDCGIRVVTIDPWFGTAPDKPKTAQALEVCEQVGLRALVQMTNGHDRTYFTQAEADAGKIPDGYKVGDEKPLVSFESLQTDYTQYDAFEGFYVIDEPDHLQLDWLSNDLDKWNASARYSDYTYLINLMWCTAGPNTTQEDFMELYWDKILSKNNDKIVLYDVYPLCATVTDDGIEPYINRNTLKVTEEYARFSKRRGAEMYSFIQTTAYDQGQHRKLESSADVRFQIGYNMAYGSKGFDCFTYLTKTDNGFGEAMVGRDGSKYPAYYYVQEAFQQMFNWEHVYLSFNWQGTMTLPGTATGYGTAGADHFNQLLYSLDSHERIKSVERERDLLVGTFKDKEGYDGFLFTTYADPYYRKSNDISVEFNHTSKALVYLNGQLITNDENDSCYLIENGKFDWTLEAGDILFVIPVK